MRSVFIKNTIKYGWLFFFRGTLFFFFFTLVIWVILWSLDFSEKHQIKFYPPDSVIEYLTNEHASLEAIAREMTSRSGKNDSVSFELFDPDCIKVVNPIKIYCDEYGIYLTTSKSWYNGEHGIFIAKDNGNMPPDLNWGLIEGQVFTYAIFD